MPTQTIIVPSGFVTSSAFQLDRARWAIMLPNSTTAAQLRVQQATAIDANSGAFATVSADGAPLLVHSGSGPFIAGPLTALLPFARLLVTTAPTGTSSYLAIPIVG